MGRGGGTSLQEQELLAIQQQQQFQLQLQRQRLALAQAQTQTQAGFGGIGLESATFTGQDDELHAQAQARTQLQLQQLRQQQFLSSSVPSDFSSVVNNGQSMRRYAPDTQAPPRVNTLRSDFDSLSLQHQQQQYLNDHHSLSLQAQLLRNATNTSVPSTNAHHHRANSPINTKNQRSNQYHQQRLPHNFSSHTNNNLTYLRHSTHDEPRLSASKPSGNSFFEQHNQNYHANGMRHNNDAHNYKQNNNHYDNTHIIGRDPAQQHHRRVSLQQPPALDPGRGGEEAVSPALTYGSSRTPSTLSPATPFFGTFAQHGEMFESGLGMKRKA